MPDDSDTQAPDAPSTTDDESSADAATDARRPAKRPRAEHGGPSGLEPTRYGDWERNGRCYDF